MTEGERNVLDEAATLQMQRVTASQDDRRKGFVDLGDAIIEMRLRYAYARFAGAHHLPV